MLEIVILERERENKEINEKPTSQRRSNYPKRIEGTGKGPINEESVLNVMCSILGVCQEEKK